MAGVEKQVTVNVPVEKAFAYVSDMSRHSEWGKAAHKLEIKKTSDGPIGQGSTFASVGHQFGENHDALTITEYVPNQRLVFEADGNAGLIRHSFVFSPADGGTQLSKSFDIVKPKFPLNVLSPILKAFVLPGNLEGDLQRIKANLEGAP
jgi:uncharacterized protein YndB with AHSA1/START domain